MFLIPDNKPSFKCAFFLSPLWSSLRLAKQLSLTQFVVIFARYTNYLQYLWTQLDDGDLTNP